jgi:hypothetical protein
MMKHRTIHRKISVRRSPVPRRAPAVGAFGGMLARLGLATEQLRAARQRMR